MNLTKIFMCPKVTFLDLKWLIFTFKCIFYAKIAITGPEVIFSDPETISMASKMTFVYQEVLFAKPEVTSFLPEVKIFKPEVGFFTSTKILMYVKMIFLDSKWLKNAF